VRIPSNTSSASIALIEVSIKRGYLQIGHKQSYVLGPKLLASNAGSVPSPSDSTVSV